MISILYLLQSSSWLTQNEFAMRFQFGRSNVCSTSSTNHLFPIFYFPFRCSILISRANSRILHIVRLLDDYFITYLYLYIWNSAIFLRFELLSDRCVLMVMTHGCSEVRSKRFHLLFFAMRLKEAFGNLIFDLDKSTKKQMKWKRKQKHSKMRTHKFSKPKLIGSFRVNFLTHADDLYSLSNAVTAAQHKKKMNFNYDLLRKQNALIPLKLGENQRVWFECEVV